MTDPSLKIVTITYDSTDGSLSIDGWGMGEFEILGMLDAAIRMQRNETEYSAVEISEEEEG